MLCGLVQKLLLMDIDEILKDFKGTKGKFDVSTSSDNDDVVIRSPKGIVANCTVDCWDEVFESEQKANAKLFANSKNHLAALILLNKRLETFSSSLPDELRQERSKIIELINETLA